MLCGWSSTVSVGGAPQLVWVETGRWCGWSPKCGVHGAWKVVWVEPHSWCGWSPAGGVGGARKVVWVEPRSAVGGAQQLVLTRLQDAHLSLEPLGLFFHMPV